MWGNSHQRQQHGKRFLRLHRVRQSRRHVQLIARAERARLALQEKLAASAEDLHQRMMRRCMLGQLLSLRKAEEHLPRAVRTKQRAADNPIRRVLRLVDQRDDFRFVGEKRLFGHAGTIVHPDRKFLDAGQTNPF